MGFNSGFKGLSYVAVLVKLEGNWIYCFEKTTQGKEEDKVQNQK
jgi:hypothetical protein